MTAQPTARSENCPTAPTPSWTITLEHARAVLGAALGMTLCTCGTNVAAASHHTATCPHRLVLESAQILSLLAPADIAHYKGHASLAEMVATHISVFPSLIGRAARGDTEDVGSDVDALEQIDSEAYVAHKFAAHANIESACRRDLRLPSAIAVLAAPPHAGKPVAWRTTHKAVCVPITEDVAIADMWRANGYAVIELCAGATSPATAAAGGAQAASDTKRNENANAEQIASALLACDLTNVSIGDKAIIQAAIDRLRADATHTAALTVAARAVVREALDNVDVHPCDTHNDDIRSRGLPEPVRGLWLVLNDDASGTRAAR